RDDLAHQGYAEHPGREADVEVREDRDHRDHREAEPVPLHVPAVAGRLERREVSEAPDERDLEHAVGGDHRESARHPQLAAESMTDEAVETPRRGDLARTRD